MRTPVFEPQGSAGTQNPTAAYQQWLPIQARMVGCASASTYQGSTESPLWTASSPREWGAAKVHPTTTFACLTACRTRLLRTSAS